MAMIIGRGDSVLFPVLLKIARSEKLQLLLDRDRVFTERKIETEGRTYLSYGNIIYKPPSYPLFGRWHIDRENSFAHHEAGMEGLLEQARLARAPVQRMARIMWNFGEFQVWERLIGRLS